LVFRGGGLAVPAFNEYSAEKSPPITTPSTTPIPIPDAPVEPATSKIVIL
jgi:hypothetical protein